MTKPADARPREAPAAGASGAPRRRQQPKPGPSNPNLAMLKRALELHQTGSLREAEPLYRAVLQNEPRRVVALLNLSTLLSSAGRVTEARALDASAVLAHP